MNSGPANPQSGRLYLVDGMSHIYRAYYAIQGLRTKKGLPTNAVYGFTNMLRKLIKEEQPEFLGVAIDLTGPTVRHEQYEGYKATRRPMPDDLASQIPYVLKVCQALCVPILSYPRYEADDVIGTLARKAAECALDVVVVTIDKDMFQLVNDRISILDTRTMLRLDRKGVEEKFGVPPEKVVDVLSLVGDSSDNIVGAPGIGDKGAKQLIQEYGSLENLLQHRDEVTRKTYRESLQQNETLIRQSRDLVTICADLPLELDLEKLRKCDPNQEVARELFAELEFMNLLDELLPAVEPAARQYAVLETAQQILDLGRDLQGKAASVAVTFAEGSHQAEGLEGVAVGAGNGKAWLIPRQLLENQPALVGKLLLEPAHVAIHDLKPFYGLLCRFSWKLPPDIRDTMLMAYLLSPNQSNFALDRLAMEYLGSKASGPAEGEAPTLFGEALANATCEKADLTWELFNKLQPQLVEKKLEPLLRDVEMPLVEVLAAMEKQGVRVDCEFLRQMSQEMEAEVNALTNRIFELAGESFNINSPRQLAVILFEKMKLPQPKKTRKAGHYATGFEVLEQLAASYDLPRLILEYRELTKLKGTYLDALPRLVNPKTGRIHTSYNQMVASTGRLSSSNPNLQNIPIKSEVGRKIRRAFIPEGGFRILAADYSQIELRVMAHLSQDPVLLDSFRRDEDIHERTAREVFGMNAVMNPKEFRRHAKVINYGIMYGLSAFGLAQNLKIDRHEAQKYIDDYFKKYEGVKKWIDLTLADARQTGYVSTLFGRIRQIPELLSSNWGLRGFGERTAVNAPIQGTAADLIKKAMVVAYREMKDLKLRSRLIMQVHDELVFEVPEEELELMSRLVTERMEGAAELSVPLRVDLAIGSSWLEAK
ncbi:MAG: DNA polymerase I [Acidobacteria bacterium]|nr:MAG: DNA polymerase I [Acidobacteriota bacterium]